jgi:hypothetical protein
MYLHVSHIRTRLNKKSECKKFFRIQGPAEKEAISTLHRVMFWCTRCREFPRQRDHIRFEPIEEECPPRAFLMARRINEAPKFSTVKTDEELDAAGVPLDLLPPESWARCEELGAEARERRSRARGRGRGGRGRDGGRRGRAQQPSAMGSQDGNAAGAAAAHDGAAAAAQPFPAAAHGESGSSSDGSRSSIF